MLTLGIESSCDETACAVLEGERLLRSNIISSSLAQHRLFGGVVPEIASRHTLENIDTVFKVALKKAQCSQEDLGLISVTYGPGLIGSLLVGVAFAKTLSYALGIPYVGVNHLHAHVFANFIDRPLPKKPFLGLVVSGGHTSIVVYANGTFRERAATRDDACGEAFDKVAKILGLGYPGGPVIEAMAKKGDPDAIPFKCGRFKDSFDFSFSGIKTGVLYYVQKCRNLKRERPDICASFQKSVVTDIVTKTLALARLEKVDHIAVGGGVSANSFLRRALTDSAAKEGIEVLFPPISQSLDNGAMIARYGYELFKRGHVSDLSLAAVPALGFD
jgi:N6-L-threonylcarbamoyladenine synthase